MLFNQTPVLDKGFVAHVSTGLPSQELEKLAQHYYKGKTTKLLLETAAVTMVIKCPLFLNLYLNQEIGLRVTSVVPASDNGLIETYTPTVSDIACSEVKLSQEIREHMEQTSESLQITSKGYEKDGCDRFVSQVNMPLSVYNEVIAHGTLEQWLRFLKQRGLPKPIEAYRKAVLEVIKADYPNVSALINKVY